MKKINLYIAGKVSKDSVFGTHAWRDRFCLELSRLSGLAIKNFDPTRACGLHPLNENDAKLVFGRDCYMISRCDVVVVYLTDDISVGGSQEMLLAKYYHKPLIGIAPKGGKFNKDRTELFGKHYQDWKHPFVAAVCDYVTEDVKGAAQVIKKLAGKSEKEAKNLSILQDAVDYYKREYYQFDPCVFS